MSKTEWTIITDEKYERTERLEVPNGWLYRSSVYAWNDDDLASKTVAMVFVPNQVNR